MLKAKITCQLSIDANRKNTCYLFCVHTTCDRQFRCKFFDFNDQGNCVVILSNKESVIDEEVHPSKTVHHRKIRGTLRQDFKQKLKTKSLREIHDTVNEGIDHQLAERGNLQHKVNKPVLQTICTEIRKEERVGCIPMDAGLWALSKNWEDVAENL